MSSFGHYGTTKFGYDNTLELSVKEKRKLGREARKWLREHPNQVREYEKWKKQFE